MYSVSIVDGACTDACVCLCVCVCVCARQVPLIRELLPTLDYEEKLSKELAVQERTQQDFEREAQRVLEAFTGKRQAPWPPMYE